MNGTERLLVLHQCTAANAARILPTGHPRPARTEPETPLPARRRRYDNRIRTSSCGAQPRDRTDWCSPCAV